MYNARHHGGSKSGTGCHPLPLKAARRTKWTRWAADQDFQAMDPPSSRSRVDQDAQNYSQSQALSMSGESDYRTHETTHRDRVSLYSYRSRDILNFVREIDGRVCHHPPSSIIPLTLGNRHLTPLVNCTFYRQVGEPLLGNFWLT
jgi:hypothetical protein